LFVGNNIIGDNMRKMWFIVIIFLLFSGCMIANTPTSKVEEYLGKYQKLDDELDISYIQLSIDEDIDADYREKYRKLIERQYKNLSYEIKEEEIDGENAYVTAQIKVYDYMEVLDKYAKNSYDGDEYHKVIIESLEDQMDKITYTILFELEKNDKDEWELLELSLDDYNKLLGIN